MRDPKDDPKSSEWRPSIFARDQWHCRICGDRFSYSEMVRAHIANEHKETMPPSISRACAGRAAAISQLAPRRVQKGSDVVKEGDRRCRLAAWDRAGSAVLRRSVRGYAMIIGLEGGRKRFARSLQSRYQCYLTIDHACVAALPRSFGGEDGTSCSAFAHVGG